MAKTKKEIIPRNIQKLFVVSAVLLLISNLVPYTIYAIDAASRNTPPANVTWIYQWLLLGFIPTVIFVAAFLLGKNTQGRLWRVMTAMLYSMFFSLVGTLISIPIYVLMFSRTIDTHYYDYLMFAPAAISAILTVIVLLIVRFSHSQKLTPPNQSFVLLIAIVAMYFILQVYYMLTDRQIGEIFVMTVFSIIGAAALLILTYLLLPSGLSRTTRITRTLTYALIPATIFNAVTILPVIVPFLINKTPSTISDMFSIPLVVLLAVIYIVILLWAYRKKYL